MKDIVIIGAGRLGRALARALDRAGYKVRAAADVSPSATRRMGRLVHGCRTYRDNRRAAGQGRVIFLCVPDSAIARVAVDLADSDLDWRGRVVAHCSGLLGAEVLEPLRRRGALTASSHPAQSFPARTPGPEAFRGIVVGLEGGAAALARLRPLWRRLGAETVRLRPEAKPLYHAACSLASNGLVALLNLAARALSAAGFSEARARRTLLPLAQGTLHNVNKVGIRDALTGPIVRGDVETVARHLRALARLPGAREAYRKLGLAALDLSSRRPAAPAARVRALKRLLEGK
jgi:predicted short-subunit dehydrogenase-like oxidoreductase (DUF2520 family)